MRKKLGLLTFTLALTCYCSAVTITSNPVPASGTGSGFNPWGNDTDSSFSVVGQTFVVPDSTNTLLTGFSFWGHDYLGFGSLKYDIVIAEWNASLLKPVSELFRSGPQLWTSPQDGSYQPLAFADESVQLNTGTDYIALLDASPYANEKFPNTDPSSTGDPISIITYISAIGNTYADGGIYYLFAQDDGSQVIDNATYNSGLSIYDLTFSATFEDPSTVPSNENTLVLLGLGLGLGAIASRRVNK